MSPASNLPTFGTVTVLGDAAPHTTPVAMIRFAGRWWFTTSRRAAKVAMLRHRPTASLTLPSQPGDADGVTTVTGSAVVVDPAEPTSLLRTPSTTTAAVPAAVHLLARHATDVAGYLADVRDLPFDWSPIGRVLVAVDEHLVERHPAPAPTIAGPGHPHDAGDPDELPDDLTVACVVGVRTGGLPCGIAATFDGHRVRVGPLARPIDLEGGIAVVIDGAMADGLDDTGLRPSERRGILVRGRIDDMHPTDDGTGDQSIGLIATSITRWSGFDSTTRRFVPAA